MLKDRVERRPRLDANLAEEVEAAAGQPGVAGQGTAAQGSGIVSEVIDEVFLDFCRE